jgi:hypothetical protein
MAMPDQYVTIRALLTVIEKHKLEPDCYDNYKITPAMVAEGILR